MKTHDKLKEFWRNEQRFLHFTYKSHNDEMNDAWCNTENDKNILNHASSSCDLFWAFNRPV